MRHLLPASLGLVTALAGQTAIVVPGKAASVPANFASPWMFWGSQTWSGIRNEGHTLFLYDVSDIPVASALLTAMQTRRPSWLPNSNPAMTANLKVIASVSPATSASAAPTFAANHGAQPIQVFKGTISLPQRNPGAWPAPWEAAIPFSVPFAYARTAGNSLVVETLCDSNSWGECWWVEAYRLETGDCETDLFQPTCRSSTGGVSALPGFSPTSLIVGGSLVFECVGYPNYQPSLHMNAICLGAQGKGGNWGSLSLPFPLASLQIPAPAGCQWGIDILATLPGKYNPSGSTIPNCGTVSLSPGLPVPNQPALANQSFYAQVAAMDTNPSTQRLEVWPSASLKFTIGSGAKIPAATVWHVGDNGRPTGAVGASEAVTLRLF